MKFIKSHKPKVLGETRYVMCEVDGTMNDQEARYRNGILTWFCLHPKGVWLIKSDFNKGIPKSNLNH